MNTDPVTALLADAATRLRAAGVESPRREARLLLAYVLGVGVLDIVAGKVQETNEGTRVRFEIALRRRVAREPLAYIVGRREFWSLDFEVAAAVLIPRPESEILVEEALRRFPDRNAVLRVADLGTGSGCLLLAFLSERPLARGVGVDMSQKALEVAARNAQGLGMTDRAQFVQSDWHGKILGTFDAIFVNPPYIPTGSIAGLAPEVAHFEPPCALDGGPDGLDAYRALAPGLAAQLSQDGCAFLEIGQGQGAAVEVILLQNGFSVLGTVCDLAGIPRCLVAGAATQPARSKKELALETRSG